VQSALVRTHRSWRRLHRTDNAEAYTRRTMYHLQVSWWRRYGRGPLELDVVGRAGSVADHAPATALRLSLRAALLKLGPRQRAVIVLRFFEDLTEAETADVLDVTVGTVKSQTAKALARLRTLAPELGEATLEGRIP
jgi:RNA polymerase sigma factor (sigma-70 family)